MRGFRSSHPPGRAHGTSVVLASADSQLDWIKYRQCVAVQGPANRMEELQNRSRIASVEQEDSAEPMEEGRLNALGNAASGYLRSAMHQPVDWMEWGQAAFDRALNEDKPILLDIGAVWCHWCHVMDRESYEDPATARIINDNFVAVKVDRD